MEEKEFADIEKIEIQAQKSKFKYSKSDLTAILAVILSLGALSVSILQANIMKEQQKIMQEQQMASVMPFPLLTHVINQNKNGGKLLIKINNKGFGPALIKELRYYFDGKKLESSTDLFLIIQKELGKVGFNDLHFGNSADIFLSPNEEYKVFGFSFEILDSNNATSFIDRIDIEFCYCSITEKCWEYKDNNRTPLTYGCTQ